MIKYIKAGPGAGYNITAEVELTEVLSISEIENAYTNLGGKSYLTGIEFDCEIKGFAENIEARSYMYYGKHSDPVPCMCYHGYIEEDEDFSSGEYKDILWDEDGNINIAEAEKLIRECMVGKRIDTDLNYGGGYIHSTWDGELSGDDYDMFVIYVTDSEVVDYIDRAVSGDNDYTTYDVLDNNRQPVTDEPFEDYDEAVEYAQENGYVLIRTDYWTEDSRGNTDLEYSDITNI